jgi:hypothetical protein
MPNVLRTSDGVDVERDRQMQLAAQLGVHFELPDTAPTPAGFFELVRETCERWLAHLKGDLDRDDPESLDAHLRELPSFARSILAPVVLTDEDGSYFRRATDRRRRRRASTAPPPPDTSATDAAAVAACLLGVSVPSVYRGA